MSILANPLRLIFFFYLFYLYYSYVRPVPADSTVREVANLITDYGIHFISFFILGALAQLANNKNNDFVFGFLKSSWSVTGVRTKKNERCLFV